MHRNLGAWLVGLLLLAIAAPGLASPITYNFTGGTAPRRR